MFIIGITAVLLRQH